VRADVEKLLGRVGIGVVGSIVGQTVVVEELKVGDEVLA